MADGVKGRVPPIIRGRRSATLGVAKPAQKVIPPTTAASTTSKGAPDDAGTGGDRGSRPRKHNMQAAARAMDRATGMSADASRTRAGAASASTGPLSPLRSSTSRVALALEVVGATGLVSKGQSAPLCASLGSGVADTERCREKLRQVTTQGGTTLRLRGSRRCFQGVRAQRGLSSTRTAAAVCAEFNLSPTAALARNEHAGRCGLRRIRSAADRCGSRALGRGAQDAIPRAGGWHARTHTSAHTRTCAFIYSHAQTKIRARSHPSCFLQPTSPCGASAGR